MEKCFDEKKIAKLTEPQYRMMKHLKQKVDLFMKEISFILR